jgi:hypothetical protein
MVQSAVMPRNKARCQFYALNFQTLQMLGFLNIKNIHSVVCENEQCDTVFCSLVTTASTYVPKLRTYHTQESGLSQVPAGILILVII